MFYTIYEIKNNINGKIYVGKHKTKDVNDLYMGSGKHLRHAIKKYGTENFTKKILFIFHDEEEMNKKEAELVTEEFCKRDDTYNICVGGNGGFSYVNSLETACEFKKMGGMSHSKEHMKKIGDKGKETIRKKLNSDANFRKKFLEKCLSSKFSGMLHTEETKKKIGKTNSAKQSGKGNSQYGKMWIYSDEEKSSVRIDKQAEIPEGWKKGRKINFLD